MDEKTDASESAIKLSLEERFSALGSVVGKLSKCIDDRNVYIHNLEGQLKAAKDIHSAISLELYTKIDDKLTRIDEKYHSLTSLEEMLTKIIPFLEEIKKSIPLKELSTKINEIKGYLPLLDKKLDYLIEVLSPDYHEEKRKSKWYSPKLKLAFNYVGGGMSSIYSRLYKASVKVAEIFEEEEDPLYNFGVKVWGRFKKNPK
jgi:archaellum component FlaC